MALGKVGSPSHTREKQSFRKNATSWKPRFSFSAIRPPRTQRHRKSPLQRRGLRCLRANWLLQIRHCLKHLSCDPKEATGGRLRFVSTAAGFLVTFPSWHSRSKLVFLLR